MRGAGVLARRLRLRLAQLWRGVRALAGEDAYERYLSHLAAHHPGEPVLTRRAFFADQQRRRWSRVSRCC